MWTFDLGVISAASAAGANGHRPIILQGTKNENRFLTFVSGKPAIQILYSNAPAPVRIPRYYTVGNT